MTEQQIKFFQIVLRSSIAGGLQPEEIIEVLDLLLRSAEKALAEVNKEKR